MAVRIGINPIGWTNDDVPELGGDTPLEVCLSEAKAAGYAGIELGGKFPREAAVLGPILAAHGLALLHAALGEKAEALRALDRAATQRASDLAFMGTDPLLDPLRAEPAFAALQERLRRPRAAE